MTWSHTLTYRCVVWAWISPLTVLWAVLWRVLGSRLRRGRSRSGWGVSLRVRIHIVWNTKCDESSSCDGGGRAGWSVVWWVTGFADQDGELTTLPHTNHRRHLTMSPERSWNISTHKQLWLRRTRNTRVLTSASHHTADNTDSVNPTEINHNLSKFNWCHAVELKV